MKRVIVTTTHINFSGYIWDLTCLEFRHYLDLANEHSIDIGNFTYRVRYLSNNDANNLDGKINYYLEDVERSIACIDKAYIDKNFDLDMIINKLINTKDTDYNYLIEYLQNLR